MNKGKVGEWVRHTSSSGKEYYFHVTKQISQWEKPREWLEYEKKHGPVPNTPSSSSSQKQNQNKIHQSHQQSHNSNSNNVNTSLSDQKERERKAHAYQQQQQQLHHAHQHQQQYHHNSSHNSTSNSFSNYTATSLPLQQQQNVVAASTSSNIHHHSHLNANNNRLSTNSESSSAPQHTFTSSSFIGRNLHSQINDARHPLVSTNSSASSRDTRKPSEDLQAEDMDISPLDDSNSPVSTDSKSFHGGPNSHSHHNSHHPNFQSQYHQTHHYPTSKNLQDGSESSREENHRNSAFHQHPNSGRLIHSGSSSSIGNNGYHGRDRERDMRDSPRRIDPRDSRDFREKDSREYSRDYREKDSRDRDRNDHRDRLRRDRDARDSPRRHDRNDRDRDHRGRNRDRNDHRDNRLRHRSGSKLRDERSRSPRERDGTPERHPGGDAAGVSGLGSLGALAALSTDTETPPLPASLAQYFRHDLIAHVQDLPGDELERQANKLSDEIMTTSSIQLSKVCAELKMARSLVRLTDIQATLQDQRILFLRQQIKNLEESDRDSSSSMLGMETGDS